MLSLLRKVEPLTPQYKIRSLIVAGALMVVGLALFKALPMWLWGPDITFDASLHVTATIFGLYVLWYFIDQNPAWRRPFLAACLAIIVLVAGARIIRGAHDSIGVLLALLVSTGAIVISRWDYFRDRLSF